MATDLQEHVLYLLMRNDMNSLNHAGKLVAQGAHAANHAAFLIGQGKFGQAAMVEFGQWEKSTAQGFGTTLVFSGIADRFSQGRALTLIDIKSIVESAIRWGVPSGIINDPTYPLSDGQTVHGFPCDTCGWVFGSRKNVYQLVKDLILMPADPTA